MRAAWGGGLAFALAGCTAIPKAEVATAPVAPVAPALVVAPEPAFVLTGNFMQGGLAMGTAPAGTVALSLDALAVPVAADGRFLIGFGRDAPASTTLAARLADGREVRRVLAIGPRAWDIQSLPTLAKGTPSTPEFQKRRAAELERIGAARAMVTGADGWRQRFAWPVTGRISGVFGSQRIYAGEPGAYHSGVDIARPTGTGVAAPADGVVILAAAAPFTLEGNLLMIDHGMGLNSAFLHLSRIDVTVGQKVRQGQIVGAIGATGRATGPHLHWSLRWRDARLDPQRIVPAMQQSIQTAQGAAQ